MDRKCMCVDSGCIVAHGGHQHGGCQNVAAVTLYRVDMDDKTGTDMCSPCAEDAMDTGLFDLVEMGEGRLSRSSQ